MWPHMAVSGVARVSVCCVLHLLQQPPLHQGCVGHLSGLLAIRLRRHGQGQAPCTNSVLHVLARMV